MIQTRSQNVFELLCVSSFAEERVHVHGVCGILHLNSMKPARPDLLQTDVSKRQQEVLDYVLQHDPSKPSVPGAPRVPVAEARRGATQVDVVSERDTTRLLFISRDTSLLNQSKQTLDGYINLGEVFDEVHIMVLQPGIKPRNPVLRVSANMWVYVIAAEHWWWTPFVALRTIAEQLLFADGFRPDLIVARDPYESALVAYLAGRHYNRPTQLHITEDWKSVLVRAMLPHAAWRARLAAWLVPRFASVRTSTDAVAALVQTRYPDIPDVQVLPRFHNYAQLRTVSTAQNIKDVYKQFSFVIAYVGALNHDALAYQVMDAVRGLLRNQRIGLVYFGDGAGRAELQKRATLLGIATQVVFERGNDAVVNYFASADVVVVPEMTEASDEVVIRAAFSGVPIVAVATAQRKDLFVHAESAFLCPVGDITLMGNFVNKLLNDSMVRRSLSESAHLAVSQKLHEDPELYRIAYRDSVEAALFVGEGDGE